MAAVVRSNVAVLFSESSRREYARLAVERGATYRFTDARGRERDWLKGEYAYLAPNALSSVLHRWEIKHDRIGEDEDAAVVGAELQLALREDHPVGDLAAQLRLLEPVPVGEHGARKRHGDGCARPEVPGPADDLARLALPDVDPAELQPVGVRVRLGRDDTADDEAAEVGAVIGHADVDDLLDLERRDGETSGDLRDGGGRVDELTEPADRDLHD